MLIIILMGAVGLLLWLIGVKKAPMGPQVTVWDLVGTLGLIMLLSAPVILFCGGVFLIVRGLVP